MIQHVSQLNLWSCFTYSIGKIYNSVVNGCRVELRVKRKNKKSFVKASSALFKNSQTDTRRRPQLSFWWTSKRKRQKLELLHSLHSISVGMAYLTSDPVVSPLPLGSHASHGTWQGKARKPESGMYLAVGHDDDTMIIKSRARAMWP